MAQSTGRTETLREKVGQMLVLGWQGTSSAESQRVNAYAAALVDDLAVGGIILMARNIDAPAQVQSVLREMQARAERQSLPPLLVAIDQEGGPRTRLRLPRFLPSPSAWEIGQTRDPAQARAAARRMGEELRGLGVNWNFAPVLDVNNNPENPVIGHRSYGDTAENVAAMGVAAVRGYQEDAHILACGKHFPGHGDTNVDSHLALPRISHSLERLRDVELVPFQAAVAAGLAAVMTAHIVFDALDPALPATLSPAVLSGLLRGTMGFDGLVITDCLEMRGVAQGWGAPEAAVLAVIAGADMVLCCHTRETQQAIRDALVAAAESGRISPARIDASLARIAAAKARWLAPDPNLFV